MTDNQSSADIVERLSFDAVRAELQFSKGVAANIDEAIAEIARLRRDIVVKARILTKQTAEIARLRDVAQESPEPYSDCYTQENIEILESENRKLKAEVERLRAPAQPEQASAPTIDDIPSCGQENDYRRAAPAQRSSADDAQPTRERNREIDSLVHALSEQAKEKCDGCRLSWKLNGWRHREPTPFECSAKVERQAIRALAALPPVPDEPQRAWQPIETAPKNYTRVLLWYPWTGPDFKFAPHGFHYIGIWTCTDEDDFAWRDPDSFEKIGEGATHWTPLLDGPLSRPQRGEE